MVHTLYMDREEVKAAAKATRARKKRQREASARYRAKMSPEKKAETNDKNKLRQQKRRAAMTEVEKEVTRAKAREKYEEKRHGTVDKRYTAKSLPVTMKLYLKRWKKKKQSAKCKARQNEVYQCTKCKGIFEDYTKCFHHEVNENCR